MKNLTWQNPERLFVAQELINKVKSKCCGIKVYIYCLINDRDSLRSEKFTIQKLAIEKGIMGDDVTGIAPLSNNRQPNKCNSRLSKEDGI